MATAKQLAALKKARAARKKNLAKGTSKKKPVKRKPVKRKSNPKLRDLYVIEITTKQGTVGYYTGNGKADTIRSKAYLYSVHKDAIDVKYLLSALLKGKFRSISVKKKT